MYSWGKSCIAKHFGNESNVIPTKLDFFNNRSVQVVSFSFSVAIVLLEDGSVHTFGNEEDTSGKSSSSTTKVSALETIRVADVSVGGRHFFAIDESGRVFGWGQNTHGQLGLKEALNDYSSPKLVRSLQSFKVSEVSCGCDHSLFLCNNGTIWTAGSNQYGQLGLGLGSSFSRNLPIRQIVSLQGIPFSQIAAGYWHSFALTVSGTVFGWGRNDHGQLGLGDTNSRYDPTLLKLLRTQPVAFVSAGGLHTAALTTEGGVFTFGSNEFGQLGHGFTPNDLNAVNPRKVFELMGNKVAQISCGRSHTLAFISEARQIYSFGDNSSGQLGYRSNQTNAQFLPHLVTLPADKIFLNNKHPNSTNSSGLKGNIMTMTYIKQICAGGLESMIVTSISSSELSNFCHAQYDKKLCTISDHLLAKLEALPATSRVGSDVSKDLETAFSSQSSLNGSFLASDHYKTTSHYHGISLMTARLAFSKLDRFLCKDVRSIVADQFAKKLIPGLNNNPPDIEALRLYIILPECQLFGNHEYCSSITIPFAEKLMALGIQASTVLDRWYASLEPIYFSRLVDIYRDSIEQTLNRPLLIHSSEIQYHLWPALEFLRKLNDVNNKADKPIIPYERFYLPNISNLIDLEQDYVGWQQGQTQCVAFCNYPFLFNSIAKSSLLQIDATFQMRAAYTEAQERNMATFLGSMGYSTVEMPVLELVIRRTHLVDDAMSKLAVVSIPNLKKPFIVKFEGEEGQDAGGVRKEFFMLTLQEVLSPKFGMFRYFEDSRLMWFSGYLFETEMKYFLVGLLCGLAIYNGMIIDIHFPLALYKMLLEETPTLADLHELDPAIGRGLQQLLDYNEFDNGSIEDVFCLTFSVSKDYFDEVSTVELIPGGSSVAVNAENREDYVKKYLEYFFETSVKDQFEAFSKGFHKVCGGIILKLFRPAELMEMVVGNQNYNWEDFEKQAEYKGEYYRYHPVIDMFWKVFHDFSLEEKKEFLLFLTGCNKVPINGVKITIQPMRIDSHYLPVAHTCFNLLDLPFYSLESQMREKLKLAMSFNQGFHLA